MKIILEFVLKQMTHAYARPRNKSNTFITITIKNITWERSNKSQDVIFENEKNFFSSEG